jgi:hypothetical protein
MGVLRRFRRSNITVLFDADKTSPARMQAA